MAFAGQLSTRRKTSTTSLPRTSYSSYSSSSILSSSIAEEKPCTKCAIEKYTRHNFFPFLSLPFFSFSKTTRGDGEQRMDTCVYSEKIWGEGEKCHEAVIKNVGFQGNSRTLRDPPSSAKISGGRCCREYFVAEETSPVRASLREDRDTLSGFNGQCPLRRKFPRNFGPQVCRKPGRRRHGGLSVTGLWVPSIAQDTWVILKNTFPWCNRVISFRCLCSPAAKLRSRRDGMRFAKFEEEEDVVVWKVVEKIRWKIVVLSYYLERIMKIFWINID